MPSKKSVYIAASFAVFLLTAIASYAWVGSVFNAVEESNRQEAINLNAGISGKAAVEADPNALSISWIDPQEISDFRLFDVDFSAEDGPDSYRVGSITGGKYDGGELILSIVDTSGFPVFRSIEFGGKLYLIDKYSDYVPSKEETTLEIIEDASSTIPDLEFPAEIKGKKDRQILAKADYLDPVFFDSQGLIKIFTDPKVGDVYTNDGDKPERRFFKSDDFYVRSPDGLTQVYYYNPDFSKEGVPEIVWEDGTQNMEEYECADSRGNHYGISSVDDGRDISEYLEEAGETSKGDVIYKKIDREDEDMKSFYDEYCGGSEPCGISYDDFLAGRPIVYFVDPFDRLVEMRKTDPGSSQPAEEN